MFSEIFHSFQHHYFCFLFVQKVIQRQKKGIKERLLEKSDLSQKVILNQMSRLWEFKEAFYPLSFFYSFYFQTSIEPLLSARHCSGDREWNGLEGKHIAVFMQLWKRKVRRNFQQNVITRLLKGIELPWEKGKKGICPKLNSIPHKFISLWNFRLWLYLEIRYKIYFIISFFWCIELEYYVSEAGHKILPASISWDSG